MTFLYVFNNYYHLICLLIILIKSYLEITCQAFLSKKYKKISDFSEIFILLVDFFSTPTV